MFKWFTQFFSATAPASYVLTTNARPGQRVRRVADAIEGTLAGFVTAGEHTLARVVFCGHNSTWVALMPLVDLEVA